MITKHNSLFYHVVTSVAVFVRLYISSVSIVISLYRTVPTVPSLQYIKAKIIPYMHGGVQRHILRAKIHRRA